MKPVTDYRVIGADVLTLVRLMYFHNFLNCLLTLSPGTAMEGLFFSLLGTNLNAFT